MKTKFAIFIILQMLAFTATSKGFQEEKSNQLDSIEVIEEYNNFYKSGNYYFGGQPSLDAINWLHSEGVSLFINLRSEKENEDFTKVAFNEEKIVKDLGIDYKSIPVSYPDSYTPEILGEFIKELSAHEEKVFIHCRSCGRVRLFFMAYLVEDKGYTLNEAFKFGKQMDYHFPLENIIGKEIKMTL